MNNKNYYEILEVTMDATQEEINKAYIRAKNAYSQDGLAFYSLMSKEESEKIIDLIEEGFSVLGDAYKRRQYDAARGIVNNNSDQAPQGFQSQGLPLNVPTIKNIPSASSSPAPQMKTLVAKKKFDLDFTVSPEIEKEIESCQSFSGEFLKKIREYKNVDLIRMSEMTKVSKTYLAHIESQNTERLPADVYIRGFVYQYAKCLKLAPDLVATSYLNQLRENKSKDT